MALVLSRVSSLSSPGSCFSPFSFVPCIVVFWQLILYPRFVAFVSLYSSLTDMPELCSLCILPLFKREAAEAKKTMRRTRLRRGRTRRLRLQLSLLTRLLPR